MISYKNISKSFDRGKTYAVNDVSFDVQNDETLVLLGSSGCGKSTLLKMTNRLLDPTDGDIEVDGEHILEQNPIALRRKIGYVFQGIGLFPNMTIEKNVAMVPKLLGWSKKDRTLRAHELLETVGLKPKVYAKRYPKELSGGQQQRIGVARALATNPTYLLMDEPFGALDAITRDTLQQEVIDLKNRLKKTIIFVTHDIFEALKLGDRIAVLHKGCVEQVGTRDEILKNPASEFVSDLFAKPAVQLEEYGEMLK